MELKSLHILEGVTMYEALPTLGGGEGVMEMGIVRERGEEGEGEICYVRTQIESNLNLLFFYFYYILHFLVLLGILCSLWI